VYPKYFGLKESSFSIAPDPHYLYLSEQHKEALAHLLYGAGEDGGFVLLTGEVGTGKTTVCRAFLEQLPGNVDVALILNPTQTARELLLNIFDEFRIPLPEGRRSIKTLVDRLNQYLLESHGNGRRPVLIIDEAQNLQPQVLEQIRLLTNLETTKRKLLQIFLIGQPELRRMLECEQLRQLNQRITARFHLTPFDLKETGAYIRHRVAVAGVDRPLFTTAAIRLIYRYSGGVPRLINILCDRALLGVCVSRGSQVDPGIVTRAAREVQGAPIESTQRPVVRAGYLAAIAFVLAVAAGWVAYLWSAKGSERFFSDLVWTRVVAPISRHLFEPAAGHVANRQAHTPPPDVPPDVPPGIAVTPPPKLDMPAPEPPPSAAPKPAQQLPMASSSAMTLASFEGDALEATLERLTLPESDALKLLLRRWRLELGDLGDGDPCPRLPRFGLSCEQERGKLSNVRFFDLPVLLRVASHDGVRRFLVVTALDDREATLDLPSGHERVPIEAIERIWTGDYTLVWQTPPGGATLIGYGSTSEDVRWLRQLLAKLPGGSEASSDSPRFDNALAGALRAFQASNGLFPDGIAGPRTLIQLNNAVDMPGVPRLGKGSAITETAASAP
jgi:general secretion pathway protein A